ncbi:WD40 repeat domain-containing protein [Couchioplanes caeruleus]|uniref:WD40 repeat protein n=1 Tax=Couchioplanes caeruleus TaxID=56438 RepID=A0A3N1GDD3_9ACTN|nr:WD40 repeat domain-containing protein [Couchioplanes caeruleus]ROP28250.1 WD40 repeat protein [Couchioplanes caeruleus]
MGRPERKLDPDAGPLQRFAFDLRQLRNAVGRPSYRELSKRARFSVTALSEAAGGEVVPSLAVVLGYVAACGGGEADWELRWHQMVAELTPAGPTVEGDGEQAPYLGLATFEASDEQRFFGRQDLVEEMCQRLAAWPLLALFAPSGAGKSSLLRAGLLPAIARDAIAGSQEWPWVLMTPGEHPVDELAVHLANLRHLAAASVREALTADPTGLRLMLRQVLADRAATARVVIVVDQFEEVFTLCRAERERAAFIDMLVAAVDEPAARVVLGVRADFYARCAAYPELVAALQDRQVLVGPMSEDDLRQVIVGPARRMGLRVESALVEVAVADTRGQPGALPLLSHALLETWRRRRGPTLTLADYGAAGGVQGAIAQTAERVYARFGPVQRDLARGVFLRLTAFGEGTEDTRRRATPAELLGGRDPDAVAAVLSSLTAARLVTADEDCVTVAHEALILGWPRLRAWLAEDRDFLRAHRRLTEAAAEWDQHDREDGYLYRGARLVRWQGRPLDRLNDLETAFLAASRSRDVHERTARRRRTRLALSGLGAAVVIVGVLAAMALVQGRQASAERDLASSRQLVAEAYNELQLNPARAVTLARRAFMIAPTVEAEMVLRQAVGDYGVRAVVPLGSPQALNVVFSPDGRRLAATGADGAVRVWAWNGQTVSGSPVVLRGHTGNVWYAAFSPDGRRLATGGADGTVRIWPTDGTGAPRQLRGHTGIVWAVAFSPDGSRLASVGEDTTTRIWDTSGRVAPVVLRGHRGITSGVAFTPDGRRLATASHDRTVRIWDLAAHTSLTVLRGPQDATKTLAFSLDGTRLYASSIDGAVWAWPTSGGDAEATWRGHQGTVEGLALSADGRWLATTSDDTTVRIWSATGDGEPLVLRGHNRMVWAVAFSPDGSRLASAGEDGMIRIWDPRGPGDPALLLRGHDGAAWTAAFSPDAKRVFSGGADGVVRLWTLAEPRKPRALRGHRDEILELSVSADGRRVASASRDGTVRIWDAAGTAGPVVLRGHEGPVWQAAFSPDGTRVASTGSDGTLRIWNITGTGNPLVRHAKSGSLGYAAFSPDGKHVATASKNGLIHIWEVGGFSEPLILRGHEGLVYAVAFSPDGRSLASVGVDGTVRIWPLSQKGTPLVLRGHSGFVWRLAFSPDRKWLLSTGKDGTVRVWRTDGGGPPVTYSGFGASVETVAFSRDGTQLVTAHDDGTVRVWRCDACGPIRQVLTQAEAIDNATGNRTR